MIPRLQLTTLIGIAALIWAFFLLISGFPLTKEFFDPFSKVIGVLVIVLFIFDKWLWKFPILHPWFVSFPDISGTWKGKIISSWIDDETGEQIEPIDAFLVIHQTFSSINIQMITHESKSDLLTGNFILNGTNTKKIAGIYNNVPNLLSREKSPIHYGGLLLEIHTAGSENLEGEYWTGRNTKGILKFDLRVNKIFDNFDSALTNFQGLYLTQSDNE